MSGHSFFIVIARTPQYCRGRSNPVVFVNYYYAITDQEPVSMKIRKKPQDFYFTSLGALVSSPCYIPSEDQGDYLLEGDVDATMDLERSIRGRYIATSTSGSLFFLARPGNVFLRGPSCSRYYRKPARRPPFLYPIILQRSCQ